MRSLKISSLIPIEEVEAGAQKQLYEWDKIPFVKKIVVLPDVHQGYDLPIGVATLVEDHVSPSAIGYDIGCGMICYKINGIKASNLTEDDKLKIFNNIKAHVPVGFDENVKIPTVDSFKSASGDKILQDKVNAKLGKQFGTLGGGNHFIEIGVDDLTDELYVTIHSGSRRPGWDIGDWYMNKAKQEKDMYGKFFRLDSELGRAYVADMNFALEFALDNRLKMLTEIVKILYAIDDRYVYIRKENLINENHNHAIVTEDGVVHRKGATPADIDQLGVIPGSMKSGVYITKGLGNKEYLSSASHGAGRKMSRGQAKKSISIDDFKAQMNGIIANVCDQTLDEAPDAYKDLDYVMSAQEGKVIEIVRHLRPIINIKG